MRGEPDLELSRFGLRNLWHRSIGPRGPGFVAVDLCVLVLPAEYRIREHHILAPGLLVVVDGAGVAGHGASRPFFPGGESLAEECIHAGTRILDRLHTAHCLLGALQY